MMRRFLSSFIRAAGWSSGTLHGGRGANNRNRATPAGGYERVNPDHRAAQYAIEKKTASPRSLCVRCTHCENPVLVQPESEMAKCLACAQRFRVELAERT